MTVFLHKNKRSIGVFLIMALLVLSLFSATENKFSAFAQNDDLNDYGINSPVDIPGSKDEVIYGNLNSEGTPHDIYVVNVINVGKTGTATDYGEYTKVSNLTDTTEIENSDGKVVIHSDPGKFFYEGYGGNHEVPWIININYTLDNKTISPHKLAGVSGNLKIEVKTRKNENANPIFYDNYILQISVPMDMALCKNIQSDGGTVALSGNTRLTNFVALPGDDIDFSVTADVENFEMNSIEISGISFSMDFDMDELMSEFDRITDAVSELNSGTGELNKGVQSLSSGLKKTEEGSSTIYENLYKINSGTKKLSKGSKEINDALASMSKMLDTFSQSGDISDLIDGLENISEQLNKTSKGLNTMIDLLDSATIPDEEFPLYEIQVLMSDPSVYEDVKDEVSSLIDYASKSALFIGTYNAMSTSLGAISVGLNTLSGYVSDAAKGLKPLENISSFSSGTAKLSQKYSTFDKGIQKYLLR